MELSIKYPSFLEPILLDSTDKKLLSKTSLLYDKERFAQLTSREKEILNQDLLASIREKGRLYMTSSIDDPESDFKMALVFFLDMERINKMGNSAERNAMIYVFPEKIEEYLGKYLSRSPDGRFATTAKRILKSDNKNQ